MLGFSVLATTGCFSGGKDGDGGAGTGIGTNDGGGDGDGDGDDGPPPEEEDPGDFQIPRASGKYVYAASEVTDRVAVIDADTLEIDVVDACKAPTVVEALEGVDAGHGAVAVLCKGSDEVALIHTDAQGNSEITVRSVTPGANNLAASHDGELVFVYHDVDSNEDLGPGSDQELTVVETTPDGMTFEMTVGAHPRDVQVAANDQKAYVITADGVNVIDLDGLAMIGKPTLIPVVDDAAIDPETIEVQLSLDHGIALARVHDETWISVTDLETGELTTIELPAAPTDIDVAATGEFAIVTVPQLEGSFFFEVGLPLDVMDPFEVYDVGEEYVGLANISANGDAMILYTTVDPWSAGASEPGWGDEDEWYGGSTDTGGTDTGTDTGTTDTGGTDTDTGGTDTGTDDGPEPPDDDPRQRVTIVHRNNGVWNDRDTLFVEFSVTSVGIAPDSKNGMLIHDSTGQGWAYSLIDLTKDAPIKKLQMIPAEAQSVIFTPDGARAAVLLRSNNVQRVDMVDLLTFIVDELSLGSPPTGGGYVEASGKIFVAQEHPSGRITFIDAATKVQTVTGYELNDAVKD
jgi:hypothetical protein